MLDEKETIIAAFLRQEYHPSTADTCSQCGELDEVARFRCIDCLRGDVTCETCLTSSHMAEPLHRVEEWDDRGFFTRTTLYELGMMVHLGDHCGAPCTMALERDSRTLTVVDTHGLQSIRIKYCECAHAESPFAQLLNLGLFPASVTRPSTVISFRVLKQYHTLIGCSQVSAQDFLRSIHRITDRTWPDLDNVSDPDYSRSI